MDAVGLIVCLAERAEIGKKSLAYARAIDAGTLPCPVMLFEIPDYGVPADREEFWKRACHLAERLQNGETLLIHCGAGVGRTGTLATAVLLALRLPASIAEEAVSAAGSGAEKQAQRELIAWCATEQAPCDVGQ
jgi:predicted protein tyrosine phosphatase